MYVSVNILYISISTYINVYMRELESAVMELFRRLINQAG